MALPDMITVDEAVTCALDFLESEGARAQAEELIAAYGVFAGRPISRVRRPSVPHVASFMLEIAGDHGMGAAENNAANTLHMRIGRLGAINPRTEPKPDPGVPVDHDGNTYRLDGAGVLHFEVRNENNLVVHGLRIQVVPSEDGGPPVVALPGWHSSHSRVMDDPDLGRISVNATAEEREAIWDEARRVVGVAYYELGLWRDREI